MSGSKEEHPEQQNKQNYHQYDRNYHQYSGYNHQNNWNQWYPNPQTHPYSNYISPTQYYQGQYMNNVYPGYYQPPQPYDPRILNNEAERVYEARKTPTDPRLKPVQTTTFCSQTNLYQSSAEKPFSNKYSHQNKQIFQPERERMFNKQLSCLQNRVHYSEEQDYSEDEEDEEQLYRKTKIITKRKDPVLDTPDEIRKWIEARKRNYPRSSSEATSDCKKIQAQMSILEKKIRKKVMLVSEDPRNLMKKIKNMDILKRIILGGKIKISQNNKQKRNKGIRQLIKNKKIAASEANKKTNKGQVLKYGEKQINFEQQAQQESGNQSIQQVAIIKKPLEDKIIQLSQIEEQKSEKKGNHQKNHTKNSGLTPQSMIQHLQQKQREDNEYFSKILDYRTNSLNYKYAAKTLETNFLLQDIFQESSYLLQAIRFIAKNSFFDAPTADQQKKI